MTTDITVPKTKRQLQAERREAFYKGANFVYGYATRGNTKMPTVTVSIVPETIDGQLYFGIGISRCAEVDQPIKAVGRSRATARARAVLKMDGQDIVGRKIFPMQTWEPRILAMRVHHTEVAAYIDDFELSESLTVRVLNSCNYLINKLAPPTTVGA